MTNEKAITELSVLWERMKRAKESGVLAYKTIMYYDGQYVEALNLAIKALEVTEQVNSSHNGVQMFPKGAFKSIYNESENEE